MISRFCLGVFFKIWIELVIAKAFWFYLQISNFKECHASYLMPQEDWMQIYDIFVPFHFLTILRGIQSYLLTTVINFQNHGFSWPRQSLPKTLLWKIHFHCLHICLLMMCITSGFLDPFHVLKSWNYGPRLNIHLKSEFSLFFCLGLKLISLVSSTGESSVNGKKKRKWANNTRLYTLTRHGTL